MKKTIFLCLLGLPLFGFSQVNANKQVVPAPSTQQLLTKTPTSLGGPKTMTCNDTLRYPQTKEQVLGTGNFYTFAAWQADGEAISQTFLNTATHTIRGIEFYGNNDFVSGGANPYGTASITVQASIYNVDANYVPTTLVGSGTTTITSLTPAYRTVLFASPVTVTGNYAVVLQVTSANGVLEFFVTDIANGQSYDETLSRYKSNYYPGSGGAWVSIPTLTAGDATNFPGTLDFEPLVAPLITYSINTNFTAVPSPVCLGTQVAFTNTTTPMSIFSNRMYNFSHFLTHFGEAAEDSVFVWSMGNNTPLIWEQSHNYTYPAAGSYIDTLLTLGGFWSSCVDIKTNPITVNTVPSAAFSFTGGNTFCTGSANPIPSVTTAGGTFSGTAGLNFVSTSTGEINLATTADGTYTVTYTQGGPCPSSSNQTVTVTSAPDANFTYSAATFCAGGTNPLPVFGTGAGAGTFSSTTGLTINSATGEINLATSTPGTYTVTNAIAASGSCAASSATYNVTINARPTATLSGGGSLCAGSGNTVNVTATLTGTGPWNLAVSNGATTIPVPNVTTSPYTLPVPEAGAGTYTILTVTDALCSNTGSGSATVTVNPVPTANAVANQTVCNGAATTAVTFAGPVTGTTFAWSNSQTGIGLAASGNGSIASFTATNTTGSAVTSTVSVVPTANGCAGTPVTFTITVNPSPSVAFTTLPALVCVYGADVTLSGATPAGGTYSGTGVTGTTFDPATAGVGAETITYTYTDANNCAGTATANIEVSECLSVDESTAAGNLVVFPNPATQQVTFRFSGSPVDQAEVTILSLEGKVVYQNRFLGNQGTVDVSTLARSTYFVRIKANDKETTTKLVLN